jgi:hypothetical protein
MLKEAGKFARNHPFLAFAFAATGIWVTSENFRAMRAGEGDFWNKGIYGIGSGPFARHQRMQSLPTPAATGASTSTTTSSSSSHAMFRNPDDEPGTPSMNMPMMLHGIPSSIKRRVNHGEYGQEVLPDEYGISGMHLGEESSDAYDIMGGLSGVVPEMSGEGWA